MSYIDDNDEPLVRPFFLTRGRTMTTLPIEAMVMTSPSSASKASTLANEYRAIVELCERAQAIAEVAARLALPLGVARVLVGDLVDDGIVMVADRSLNGEGPSVAFLDRIISGIERL